MGKSGLLSQNLRQLLLEINPKSVGGYAPLSDEADWSVGLKESEYVFAFPRICQGGVMEFLESSFDQLVDEVHFGVHFKVPAKGLEVVTPEVLLIPGLGFDHKGDRLGRGKGFYDRYLENFNGITIGITFNETLYPEIPVEKHDRRVMMIVTDKEIVKIA